MTLLSTTATQLPPALATLLADASFLGERLAGKWVTPVAGKPRGSTPDRFHDDLIAGCAGARLRHIPDEAWARLLIEHLTSPDTPAGDWPTPYGWLLGPLAARAWAPLADQLDPRAYAATLGAHVRRAGFWLAPALHRGFAAHRDRRLHRLDVAMAARSAQPSSEVYRDYIDQAGLNGLRAWQRQPVLARLAAQLAADEVALISQLLADLDADKTMLAAMLRVDHLAPVQELTTGLGDRHDGGRSVCAVRFADGHRLIYRPRRHEGMELLRETVPHLTPSQLHRPRHTWVSYIATGTAADLVKYHTAAGELLAALHLAGATDIHRDNIIRTARGPAVIDAETLAHPITGFETALTDKLADRPLPPSELVHSVLRVGLLPSWDFTDDGLLLDGGHLLPDLPGASRINLPSISHPGTDAETLSYAPAPLDARRDLPGPGYDPAPYAEVVADSYAAALASALASAEPPGRGIRRMRLLLRYTRRYVDTLLNALASDLRDGLDFDLALTALPPGGTDITPTIRAAELADLRRLDVPYFEWEPTSGDIRHRGDTVGQREPHRPAAPQIAVEQALIRSTMHVRDGAPTLVTGYGEPAAARADTLANKLLVDLANRAVPTADGITWFGAEHRQHRFTRLPIGWSLYDGQAGIALAMAAGARVNPALRQVTTQALTPLLHRIQQDPAGLCRSLGPGYLHGAAGVLWALRRLPALIGDWPGALPRQAQQAGDQLRQALAAELLRLAQLAPDTAAPADAAAIAAEHDLATGPAGALAVLAEPGVADAGVLAAIAATAASLAAGTLGTDGLAHGSAGVALGLWRAACALGDATLAAAAHRQLAQDHATGWTWCTGRTGVELAATAIGVSTGLRLPTAVPVPAEAPHHLCCGLVGHALAVASPAAAVAVLDRLALDGMPRYLKPLPAGVHQPGLFQGAAGVALGVLLLTRDGLPDPLRISAELP